MLPLETKQSGGKLLPHLDLWGGGVFLGEAFCSIQREMKLGTWARRWDVGMWTGPGQGQVADTCECGSEPSGSIKMRGIS